MSHSTIGALTCHVMRRPQSAFGLVAVLASLLVVSPSARPPARVSRLRAAAELHRPSRPRPGSARRGAASACHRGRSASCAPSATDDARDVAGTVEEVDFHEYVGHGHGGRMARALSPRDAQGRCRRDQAVRLVLHHLPARPDQARSMARRSATTSSTPPSTSTTSPRRGSRTARRTRTQDLRGPRRDLGRVASASSRRARRAAGSSSPATVPVPARSMSAHRLRRGCHRLQALPQQHQAMWQGWAQVPRDPAQVPQARPGDRDAGPPRHHRQQARRCQRHEEGRTGHSRRASGRPDGRPPNRARWLGSTSPMTAWWTFARPTWMAMAATTWCG